MKRSILILLMAATAAAASAQTAAKPATAKSAAPAKTAAKPATASAAIKLPAGVPAVDAPVKTAFTITQRYQEIVVGTGDEALPGKLVKFHFTMWTAADGIKIDSSYDHPGPALKDKDGKPVLGEDGKPKLGDPQPGAVVVGQGRPFPGWDIGFDGLKKGGKRRVFIPWQLGIGAREIPARDATHPAIPGKSDLIIDLEVVDVADAPTPQQAHGGMTPPGHPGGAMPMPPKTPGTPAAAHGASAPAATPAPATPPAPAASAPTPAK
jgi:peptidylprolyl isomerase